MTASTAALWRMAAATRSRWRLLGASAALASGTVLAGVGLLATSGYLISRAAQHPDILALGVTIAAVRSLAIARAALRYGERLVSHDLAFRTLADLRRRFFRPPRPARAGRRCPASGARTCLSRFVADVDRLQDLYLRAIAPVAHGDRRRWCKRAHRLPHGAGGAAPSWPRGCSSPASSCRA